MFRLIAIPDLPDTVVVGRELKILLDQLFAIDMPNSRAIAENILSSHDSGSYVIRNSSFEHNGCIAVSRIIKEENKPSRYDHFLVRVTRDQSGMLKYSSADNNGDSISGSSPVGTLSELLSSSGFKTCVNDKVPSSSTGWQAITQHDKVSMTLTQINRDAAENIIRNPEVSDSHYLLRDSSLGDGYLAVTCKKTTGVKHLLLYAQKRGDRFQYWFADRGKRIGQPNSDLAELLKTVQLTNRISRIV